ncbi:hydantoinase B/oxoprolinase family protein [Pseudochelatococcus sp. B33]
MTSKSALNGAQLSILINRIEGIARKMTNTLYRTGRSGVLNRARDFSCCILTAGDELLATADSLPIHVLAGPELMSRYMKEVHPDLKSGDAFLHNSPYHGSSHPADHGILVPVVDEDGKHRFTILVKAHQADCGNSLPTTYMGAAVDVYNEGALIFPAVKVQSDYRNIDDIIRLCEMRIRVPEQWHGDFLAMTGAARIGEQEILLLGRELGWDLLSGFATQWLDYSEVLMTERLSQFPAGTTFGDSAHDPIPGTPEEGVRIVARVESLPEEGRIRVDLRDNIDALPCGLNLSEGCARTATLIAIFNTVGGDVPRNAGSFRRVDILLREGSVAGIAKHPTSCSVATTNVADRVTNAVSLALSKLGSGFGSGEFGGSQAPASSVISGIDPRTGEPFVNQLFLGSTVGAATSFGDAWLTYLCAGNGGMCFLDSVEVDELYHPIVVWKRALVKDSEGAGRYRGASGLVVEYGPLAGDVELGYVSDGNVNAPRGADGGGAGASANQWLRDADGQLHPLAACAQIVLKPGERIVSLCCGGGGYGTPLERPAELVSLDLAEGWISAPRARDVYGVVIAADGHVLSEETRARRHALLTGTQPEKPEDHLHGFRLQKPDSHKEIPE